MGSDLHNFNTGITLQPTAKGTVIGFIVTNLNSNVNVDRAVPGLPYASSLGNRQFQYFQDKLNLLAQVANSELDPVFLTFINDYLFFHDGNSTQPQQVLSIKVLFLML